MTSEHDRHVQELLAFLRRVEDEEVTFVLTGEPISVLRAAARRLGILAYGSKADLVARIAENIQKGSVQRD